MEKNREGGIRESKTWWVEVSILSREVGEPIKLGIV